MREVWAGRRRAFMLDVHKPRYMMINTYISPSSVLIHVDMHPDHGT